MHYFPLEAMEKAPGSEQLESPLNVAKLSLGWIDVLKGIGIVAVVAGHGLPWTAGGIVPLIFLFYMPLFFFLSGYLCKPDPDFKRFFRRKAVHLLVPYLSFLVLVFVLPALYRAGVSSHLQFSAVKAIAGDALIGGRRLQGTPGVFWFVTCLFLTQRLFNFLAIKLRSSQLALVILAALCASFLNSICFPNFWLPLDANVVAAALPIFYAGYMFKRYENNRLLVAVSVLFAVAAVGMVLVGVRNFYDMKNSVYGIPIVTLVSAISVTVALFAMAKKMDRVPFISSGLIALGKGSMVIMYLHLSIIHFRDNFGSIRGIVAAIAVSYLAYLLIRRFGLTRALLLGSEADFKNVFSGAGFPQGHHGSATSAFFKVLRNFMLIAEDGSIASGA